MRSYVLKPNLPEAPVHLLIAGERYRALLEEPLRRLMVDILWMPDCDGLDKRLACHTDLSVLHLGGNRLILARNFEGTQFVKYLINKGAEIIFSSECTASDYPFDCNLNCCVLDDSLIANMTCCDSAVIQSLPNKKTIDVKQGYAKCSVCVVNEHSVITADAGISRKLRRENIDVLEISPQGIELEGYDMGFIGGATFKLSSSVLAATGSLKRHPDRERIESFLAQCGVSLVQLTDEPIFDIGSAIPFI